MRVLLITTSYPMSRNGSEAAGSFVEDFTHELLSQGVSIAVVFPVMELQKIDAEKELTLFPFKVPSIPLSTLSIKKPSDWLSIGKTLHAGDVAVARTIDEFKPDFIFSLWALPSGYWAYRYQLKTSTPYGIWALGSDIWTLGKIPFIKNVLGKVLKASSINFADGHQLAHDVEMLSGGTCSFLPSTRKLSGSGRMPVREDPPYRLTFIGRWHPNKGIDILLDALLQMDELSWTRIESVVVAGGGPLKDVVKHKICHLKQLNRPIIFKGFVDKDDAVKILSETDYLLIPSRIESIPVIFSDAMQTGCPVVATPVGDLPKIVEQFYCGVVADDVSVDAYKIALASALTRSAADYNEGVSNAAKQFSLDVIGRTFIDSISG